MIRRPAATPAHLGLLAGLLIWHALLAADYVIARLGLALDLPSLDPVFAALPGWVQIGWALGIWMGLAAAIFALIRDDAAVLLFFGAFLGMAVAVAGAELAGARGEIFGLNRLAVFLPLVLVPLLGWVYTRSAKRAGLLY